MQFAGISSSEMMEGHGAKMKSDTLEYALFLCRGYTAESKSLVQDDDHHHVTEKGSQILVLDEAVTHDFEDQIQNQCPKSAKTGTHLRVVLMNPDAGIFMGDRRQTYALFEKHWSINMRDMELLSSQLVSSYHSRTTSIDGEICLEISYNISEFLSYAVNEMDPFESSLTLNATKPSDMLMHYQCEPLYFRYNIITGQTTYIVLNAHRHRRNLLNALGEDLSEMLYPKLHPFTLHTVVLFNALSTRATEIDNLFRRLLWIENQIYQGSIFETTNSENFTRYIQLSHKMSRNLITLEHRNQRDASNIDRLLRDHNRLWKLTRRYPDTKHNIELRTHEHVRDSLLCLKDFCRDRERQIKNLHQKTQNFITLLYNLITGHDSAINLRIASQSAKIAHESKQDSTSMKIIAAVTMFYLPATFVCSLFGTNLVALNTNDSEPTFVVSKLWWLYIVFAVPLTVVTILAFTAWRKWRGQTGERRPGGDKSFV